MEWSWITNLVVWAARRDEFVADSPKIWEMVYGDSELEKSRLFRVDLTRHLALFRVSKQIYREAFPCYYSNLVFYLHGNPDLVSLFDNFSGSQLKLISSMVWLGDAEQMAPNMPRVASLPRLRTLIFDLSYEGLTTSEVHLFKSLQGLEELVLIDGPAEQLELLRSMNVAAKVHAGEMDIANMSTK